MGQAGNHAPIFRQPDRHREFALAFPELRGRLAAEGGLHHVLNVLHVQAQAGCPVAVNVDHQLWQIPQAVNFTPLHALHLFDFALDGFGDTAQLLQVLARHLDDDLPLDL